MLSLLLGDPSCFLPSLRASELELLSSLLWRTGARKNENCLFLVFSSMVCDAQHIWRWAWSIWQGREDLDAGAVSTVQEDWERGSAKGRRGGQAMWPWKGGAPDCCVRWGGRGGKWGVRVQCRTPSPRSSSQDSGTLTHVAACLDPLP